ncbi:MAG: hypothetical protein ACYTG0_30750 [Planctomycetota bacterium]|jgi:hypothetical protein
MEGNARPQTAETGRSPRKGVDRSAALVLSIKAQFDPRNHLVDQFPQTGRRSLLEFLGQIPQPIN